MKCIICGNEQFLTLWQKGRFNEEVRNVICSKCGLVFVWPRPKLFEDFYTKAYRDQYVGKDKVSDAAMKSRELSAERRYDSLMNEGILGTPGRALDIGSGSGHFLKKLADNGWETAGCDPDEEYTGYARDILKLPNITSGFFDPKDYQDHKFDLVTMFHVLEHLDNPLETLQQIRTLMAPDSKIVIEVPDIERPYRGDLSFFFQSAHNYTFSQNSLTDLLALSGFKTVLTTHYKDFLLIAGEAADVLPLTVHPQEAKRIQSLLRRARLGYLLLWKWVKPVKHLLKKWIKK